MKFEPKQVANTKKNMLVLKDNFIWEYGIKIDVIE